MIMRAFFVLSIVVALVLVLIAVGEVPQHTPEQPVIDGQAVWVDFQCEACHTLYGQGGAYAPDLTHIVSQRGEYYIREFLVNPNAFHPDERVMPRLTLTVTETDNLLAFLSWVDTSTTWPPQIINVSGGGRGVTVADAGNIESDDPVERGRALFSRAPAICSTCHSLEPDVVVVGPSLMGIANRAGDRVFDLSDEEYIRQSIINPSAYVVDGFPDAMQKNLGSVLTSQDIDDLIAFLMTLEGGES